LAYCLFNHIPNSYSMKKYFSFLTMLLLAYTYLFAQNVGIGDPLPSAKLTISGSETAPNGQAASLKIINTASTNAWYLRAGATGTNTPAANSEKRLELARGL